MPFLFSFVLPSLFCTSWLMILCLTGSRIIALSLIFQQWCAHIFMWYNAYAIYQEAVSSLFYYDGIARSDVSVRLPVVD